MTRGEDTLRYAAGYPGCLLIGGLLALVMVGGALFALVTDAASLVVAGPQLVLGLALGYLCGWRKSLSIDPSGRTVHRSGLPFLKRKRVLPTDRIVAVHRVEATHRAPDGGRRLARSDVTLVIDDDEPIVVPGLVSTERAIDLAKRLRVPFEHWDDGRLKERRDAGGRFVMNPPSAAPGPR